MDEIDEKEEEDEDVKAEYINLQAPGPCPDAHSCTGQTFTTAPVSILGFEACVGCTLDGGRDSVDCAGFKSCRQSSSIRGVDIECSAPESCKEVGSITTNSFDDSAGAIDKIACSATKACMMIDGMSAENIFCKAKEMDRVRRGGIMQKCMD